jgi:hypothetical protein
VTAVPAAAGTVVAASPRPIAAATAATTRRLGLRRWSHIAYLRIPARSAETFRIVVEIQHSSREEEHFLGNSLPKVSNLVGRRSAWLDDVVGSELRANTEQIWGQTGRIKLPGAINPRSEAGEVFTLGVDLGNGVWLEACSRIKRARPHSIGIPHAIALGVPAEAPFPQQVATAQLKLIGALIMPIPKRDDAHNGRRRRPVPHAGTGTRPDIGCATSTESISHLPRCPELDRAAAPS